MARFYFDLVRLPQEDKGEICAIILEQSNVRLIRIAQEMFSVIDMEWDANEQYIKGEWIEDSKEFIQDDFISGKMLIINMEIDKVRKELEKENTFIQINDIDWEERQRNEEFNLILSEKLDDELNKFNGIGKYRTNNQYNESTDFQFSSESVDNEEMIMRALSNGQGDKLGY